MRILQAEEERYTQHTYEVTDVLSTAVDNYLVNRWVLDIINRYVRLCSDEEYEIIREKAIGYFEELPNKENQKVISRE